MSELNLSDEDMRYSLKEIVEVAYITMKGFSTRVNKDGYPFEYQLKIGEGDYPQTFSSNSMGKICSDVIGELVANALKSIFGIKDIADDIIKGRYDKRIFEEKTPYINIGLEDSSNEYLITVANNGPQIEKKNLNKIWEIGFSTFGTMGIGLYGIKKIIEKNYKGSVDVQSDEKETKFSVHIPK